MIESFNTSKITVANLEQQLDGEQFLTDIEKHKLLVEWNDTARDYPQDKCIHELFEAIVERTPETVAVVFEGEQLTYRELNTRANQLAHYLQILGVGPEVLVGICVARSFEMIVGILGILKAGGAYVPIDPTYPSERIAFMLEDSSVSVLLTQLKLVEKLPQHSARVVCLDFDQVEIFQQSKEKALSKVTPDNPAYVIYTSGSTGKPKGVSIIHQGVVRLVKETNYANLSAEEVFLQLAPISFDASTFEIWGSLLNGARLVIMPPHSPSLQELGQALRQYQVTTLWLTAGLFHLMVDERLEDLKNLRQLLAGGDVLSVPHVKKLLEQLKGCILINGYGPTENTTFTCCYVITDPSQIGNSVPIGRPIANTQVYLLDTQMQLVSIGVRGEIYVGGDGLARGYFNRPDLTLEKFIPNPFSNKPGERLYKTGDLARYLPDGNIEFLGRVDHQVKIRGFRIELGEIEAALLQHPIVGQAVVIVREDIPDDKRLVAYLVIDTITVSLKPWSDYANQPLHGKVAQKLIPLLRSFLLEKLPDYMLPSSFVVLSALPLTPNSKIDRLALPIPDSARPDLEENFVAPHTPVEKVLAEIWAEVLGVFRVGIHDKFLELGGHSLLATQIVSRLRDALQVELPINSLFDSPTVAELALCIEAGREKPCKQTLPIQPVSRNQNLPLSWGQEQLWFLGQFSPDIPVYNEPCTIRFTGAINVDALEKALNEIIKRHESLRSRFITVDGQPVQVIAPPNTFNLAVVDLRQLLQEERENEALRLATQEAKQLFDLTTGPLLRATLMQLADLDYRLFLTFHHIVMDGVSLYSTFLPELTALYEVFCIGRPSLFTELPVQYADFTLWQRQWLTGEILESQLCYWKQQLCGDLPVLQLPYDRPRPAQQTFRGARQCLALSKDLTEALKTLSQQEGVTLYMTLLAAFKTLLCRYSGQEDIIVGTVSAGRNRPESEGLIGYFLNTLVLRTDMSGNLSFRQLLSRVREVTLGAYAHEDLPYQKLVKTLQPERNISQNPLFQVAFVLEPPMPSLKSGCTLSQLDIQTDAAKFDLTLELDDRPEGIIGRWEYNTDLFDASTISRMIGHFQTILAGIVANPRARISELPLLTERERQQLLVEWNNTFGEYPQDKCIHQLFEEQVERSPDAIALVFEGEQLTYQELNARANQLAHYLQTLGVGAEVLVGICVERSLEMVVGLLGILKAGGAYVPLDPDYPQERLSFMLADTQLKVLLTQEKLVESLIPNQARVVCLDTHWQSISLENQNNFNSTVSSENLSYVIYTSGSTGTPKGVAVTHQAVNRLVKNTNYIQLTPSDRVAQAANIAFDAATFEIWGALLSGAKLVIITKSVLLSPPEFAFNIHYHQVSILFLTTALFNQLASFVPQAFSSLRCLLFGGEAVDPKWVKQVLDKGAPQQLLHVYGPTENTTFSSWYLVEDLLTTTTTIPIGRAISNTQIYLLDQNLQPVPIGVPGELHIGGAGLARGYLNRPELTEEKFIPNPYSNEPGDRLYKTGDRVRYLSDGNIEFLGRIDNQVKIRGFRIELGEIEAAIAQHPTVQETVVLAREDIPDRKYLAAYIAPTQSEATTTSELRRFLKTQLPDYMVPSAFVILCALPLTPNGKVDRKSLPAPDINSLIQKADFVAPQTPTEELLASIWAKVLGVAQVGINDNFFELGGHSILATQLLSQVNDSCKVELPLSKLFEAPTVASLANYIEAISWANKSLESSTIKANEREEVEF